MSDHPKITVITPTYNRADLISETIESVLNQDYKDFEYLILDDGSTDNTAEIVKPYLKDRRVRYLFHKNSGEADTVNWGWSLAKGEYFTQINSDDPVLPGLFSEMVKELDKKKTAVLAYPDFYFIDENGKIKEKIANPDWNFLEALAGFSCFAASPGTFLRKKSFSTWKRIKNPKLIYISDIDMYWKMALMGNFLHVPKYLATWRSHVAGVSADRYKSIPEIINWFRNFFSQSGLPPVVTYYCLPKTKTAIDKYIITLLNNKNISDSDSSTMLKYYKKNLDIGIDLNPMPIEIDKPMVNIYRPLVSIVMPIYNGSKYMKEAIDSALSQTYENLEIIVVNDGSTDDTERIAKSYGNKIKYFTKTNGGVATALNLAITKANGEYISWLSHDDVYYPNKIERQIEVLNTQDKKTILYGNWEYVDANSKFITAEILQKKHKSKLLDCSLYPLLNGIFNGCSLLIRKDILLEFGLFRPEFKTTQDYELFFEILHKYPVKHIEDVLLKTRDHAGQGSKALAAIHIPESERLWTRIINSLTYEDVKRFAVNSSEFYIKLYDRLLLIGCPNSAKAALKKALPIRNGKRNVLFTTANLAGGLGRYSNELTNHLSNKYNIFLFVVTGNILSIQYQGRKLFSWVLDKPILFEEMLAPSRIDVILDYILKGLDINVVHVNGFLLLGLSLVKVIKKYQIPILYVAHDFQLICISQHLLNDKNEYCGVCRFGHEAKGCLDNNYFSNMFGKLNADKLNMYRRQVKESVLPNIDRIIYPSPSCKKMFEDFYPELANKKSYIISHGIMIDPKWATRRVTGEQKKISVGIIGNIQVHKGFQDIKKITDSMPLGKFHFTLFGKSINKFRNTTEAGEYKYRDIVDILQKSSIDLMLILSNLPETFSYTISECIGARIPMVVGNYGAQSDRIKGNDAGWIVDPPNIAEKTIDLLNNLYKNRTQLKEKQEKMTCAKLESLEEMGKKYSLIYKDLIELTQTVQKEKKIALMMMFKSELDTFSDNLQISDNDIIGNKFNGHDLHLSLRDLGLDSKQLVWNKESKDRNTFQIARGRPNRGEIYSYAQSIQKEYSLNAILNPLAYDILRDPLFLNSELVHLHLIHNYIFDIQLLPLMSKIKPLVWTLHDPWTLGGHCIYHFECKKWEGQCADCPYLSMPFPLKEDNSTLNFELKKEAIQNSEFEVIVASRWMEERVKRSPIFKGKKIHYVPFGINQDIFKPLNKTKVKRELGIQEDAFVISFRCDRSIFKGLDFIIYALERIKTEKKIVLILLKDKLKQKIQDFETKELGWVKDDHLLAQIYSASDLFLMPSVVEAFGMMAIEAMSCGALPIVLEGTSLPKIINSPSCGVAVKSDKDEYAKVVQYYIDNDQKRLQKTKKCLEFARANYNKSSFLNKIIAIYKRAIKKHSLTMENSLLLDQLKKYSKLEPNFSEFSIFGDTDLINDLPRKLLVILFYKLDKLIPKRLRRKIKLLVLKLKNK